MDKQNTNAKEVEPGEVEYPDTPKRVYIETTFPPPLPAPKAPDLKSDGSRFWIEEGEE